MCYKKIHVETISNCMCSITDCSISDYAVCTCAIGQSCRSFNGLYIIQWSYGLAVRRQYTDIQRGDIIIGTVQVKRSWIEDDPVEDATITIPIIKRVVGLPNEQIRIAKGRVYVNGQLLEEPYVEKQDGWTYTPTITLGADQYYVLGDNRIESLDSRVFGPLNVNQIIGKLIKPPREDPSPFRGRDESGGLIKILTAEPYCRENSYRGPHIEGVWAYLISSLPLSL